MGPFSEEQMVDLVSQAAEKAVPTAPLLELGGDGWPLGARDSRCRIMTSSSMTRGLFKVGVQDIFIGGNDDQRHLI